MEVAKFDSRVELSLQHILKAWKGTCWINTLVLSKQHSRETYGPPGKGGKGTKGVRSVTS